MQLGNKKLNDINDWYSKLEGAGLIRKSEFDFKHKSFSIFLFLPLHTPYSDSLTKHRLGFRTNHFPGT